MSESLASRETQRRSQAWWRRTELVAGLLVLAGALILYGTTLDDGVRPGELQGGDLITHQYAQVQARPSNAPGYPLYTMGGWLWFRLGRLLAGPEANPIPILSSYSTLWAITALVFLYLLCLEATRPPTSARFGAVTSAGDRSSRERVGAQAAGNWPVAALCTAFYAFTYFFWYYAVTTEQYTSAVAQTLAIVWLAFRWERASSGALESTSNGHSGPSSGYGDRYLLALALLAGVGLAHMITVLLIVPPLMWFVLSRRPSLLRRWRLVCSSVLLAALPLLSYAFIYVRGAQHPEWRGVGEWSSTWSWFWQFVGTQQGRAELTWSLLPLWTQEFPSLMWRELTWIGLLVGLVGLGTLGRRRAIMVYITMVLYLGFSWVDRLGNWYQVIMPVYPLLVMGIASAADRLWRSVDSRWRGTGSQVRGPVRAGLIVGLLALSCYRLAASYPRADSSNQLDDTGLQPGLAILADAPVARSAILGNHSENAAMRYLTDIWGKRSDVIVVGSQEAARILAEGKRTVYVTVDAAPLVQSEVSDDVRFSSAGLTLMELRTRPLTDAPAMRYPLREDLGDGLRLLGYDVASERPSLTLYWQASGRIGHDWSVSVRPTLDGQFLYSGDELIQSDNQHPVQGMHPTSGWLDGEVVRDDYPLTLPIGVEADGISVLVYRPVADGFENLGHVQLPWRP